jgi:spermidine dehydrogenase
MEDAVTARLDYGRLDDPDSPARIRLNSTAVRVRHRGASGQSGEVEVTYVNGGRAYKVRAGKCVLACYNAIIPSLCPELPDSQQAGLANAVRSPFVYTNVLIRNWKAWQKLGIHHVFATAGYHTEVKLDFPVSLGDYRHSRSPDEPIVLHMERAPHKAGLPRHEQKLAGRRELLETSFETCERNIRSELNRLLADGGFDAARDILGITVNRWPHGYANWEVPPDWAGTEPPWVIGRQRFGNIAIANSDAGASALTQAAIDQAFRAVDELLA